MNLHKICIVICTKSLIYPCTTTKRSEFIYEHFLLVIFLFEFMSLLQTHSIYEFAPVTLFYALNSGHHFGTNLKIGTQKFTIYYLNVYFKFR